MKRDDSKLRNRHLGIKEFYTQPLLTRHTENRALSVKATAECALMLVLSEGVASGDELSITRIGTNVVISWPASASNLVLQSSTDVATNWTTVTVSAVASDGSSSVTVPISDSRQFYRLKDLVSEKDPLEKEPTADKNVEKPPGEKNSNEKQKETGTDKDPNADKGTEGGGKDPNADKDPNEKPKEVENGGFKP